MFSKKPTRKWVNLRATTRSTPGTVLCAVILNRNLLHWQYLKQIRSQSSRKAVEARISRSKHVFEKAYEEMGEFKSHNEKHAGHRTVRSDFKPKFASLAISETDSIPIE